MRDYVNYRTASCKSFNLTPGFVVMQRQDQSRYHLTPRVGFMLLSWEIGVGTTLA